MSLLLFANSYEKMLSSMDELRALRSISREQKRQIDHLARETQKMRVKLMKLQQLEGQLRQLVNWGKRMLLDEESSLPFDAPELAGEGDGDGGLSQALSLRQQLSELEQIMEDKERSLQGLKAAIAEKQARLAATPSIWPVRGRVTSGYGYRRNPFGWGRQFHGGYDIAAPDGAPVLAAATGKVIYVGWKGTYGRTLIIDHGYGITTLYGHNSKILVKPGDEVRKGQEIGRVGNSGRSTGPHLHYEVRVWDRPVDPKNYLGGW